MNIEIRDAGLQARNQKLMQATGSGSAEEVLLRLLETRRSRTAGWNRIASRSTIRFAGALLSWTVVRASRKANWICT